MKYSVSTLNNHDLYFIIDSYACNTDFLLKKYCLKKLTNIEHNFKIIFRLNL